MQRAVSRILRGTCRKWCESDKPIVAGEEVRKKQDQKQQTVPPPKHTLGEALGWTAGIIIFKELTEQKSQYTSSTIGVNKSCFKPCPFKFPKSALAQPEVCLSVVGKKAAVLGGHSVLAKTASIDRTPFLTESLFDQFDDTSGYSSEEEPANTVVFAEESLTSVQDVKVRHIGPKLVKKVEQFAGDVMSVLGAVTALKEGDQLASSEPPITAMELLQRGASLGSSKALYNIGVMYDRNNDQKLAERYYRRAADLGHPLASYNYGILRFRKGKYAEGIQLMQYAAENGVAEAEDALKGYRKYAH